MSGPTRISVEERISVDKLIEHYRQNSAKELVAFVEQARTLPIDQLLTLILYRLENLHFSVVSLIRANSEQIDTNYTNLQ